MVVVLVVVLSLIDFAFHLCPFQVIPPHPHLPSHLHPCALHNLISSQHISSHLTSPSPLKAAHTPTHSFPTNPPGPKEPYPPLYDAHLSRKQRALARARTSASPPPTTAPALPRIPAPAAPHVAVPLHGSRGRCGRRSPQADASSLTSLRTRGSRGPSSEHPPWPTNKTGQGRATARKSSAAASIALTQHRHRHVRPSRRLPGFVQRGRLRALRRGAACGVSVPRYVVEPFSLQVRRGRACARRV